MQHYTQHEMSNLLNNLPTSEVVRLMQAMTSPLTQATLTTAFLLAEPRVSAPAVPAPAVPAPAVAAPAVAALPKKQKKALNAFVAFRCMFYSPTCSRLH
jgi:hypothetical protein